MLKSGMPSASFGEVGVVGFEDLGERHIDGADDRLRRDAVLFVVGFLDGAAAVGFVDGAAAWSRSCWSA